MSTAILLKERHQYHERKNSSAVRGIRCTTGVRLSLLFTAESRLQSSEKCKTSDKLDSSGLYIRFISLRSKVNDQLLPKQRYDSQLLEHAKIISMCPRLHDPAIGNPGWWCSH